MEYWNIEAPEALNRYFIFILPVLLVFFFWIYRRLTLIRIPSTVSGKVISIADGDSIVVKLRFRKIRVRIAGIDAPEHNQPYGHEAQLFLKNHLYLKRVRIQIVDRDRYARFVGVVTLDKKDIAIELLRRGLAWCYKDYFFNLLESYQKRYELAQFQARQRRLGLWLDNQPLEPWILRQQERIKRQRKLFWIKIFLALLLLSLFIGYLFL